MGDNAGNQVTRSVFSLPQSQLNEQMRASQPVGVDHFGGGGATRFSRITVDSTLDASGVVTLLRLCN